MTPAERDAALDEARRVIEACEKFRAWDKALSVALEPTEEQKELAYGIEEQQEGILRRLLLAAEEWQEENGRLREKAMAVCEDADIFLGETQYSVSPELLDALRAELGGE